MKKKSEATTENLQQGMTAEDQDTGTKGFERQLLQMIKSTAWLIDGLSTNNTSLQNICSVLLEDNLKQLINTCKSIEVKEQAHA